MRSGRMLGILLTACAGMLGCFVPEEFDVTLEIDRDIRYDSLGRTTAREPP